jgi:hypothetical protein
MSGSSGNTSAGTQGGRTPRSDNADIVERHGHGRDADRATDTDASTAARGTRTGRNDSVPADPDVPSSDDER